MRLGDRHGFRLRIRGGASQFTPGFDNLFVTSGITALRIPPRAPKANTFAERCVRRLRHELPDRTIICNERQVRALLVEYLAHYNTHGHRGIDQRTPVDTGNVVATREGQTAERHAICDGLINEQRKAV